MLGTGEARADAAREEFGDEFDDFVSAPLATLIHFIKRCFHLPPEKLKEIEDFNMAPLGMRLIETADAGKPAPPSRVVIKLPRYDYDEIIDALEGEEDDAADSDAGEDYELVG